MWYSGTLLPYPSSEPLGGWVASIWLDGGMALGQLQGYDQHIDAPTLEW